MTNRMIPTSMVSRIDSAIGPLSPARTQSDAWPTDAKSKPGRPAGRRPTKRSATLMETNCSLRRSNGEQVNRLAALSLKRGKSVDFGGCCSGTSKEVYARAKASHPRRSV